MAGDKSTWTRIWFVGSDASLSGRLADGLGCAVEDGLPENGIPEPGEAVVLQGYGAFPGPGPNAFSVCADLKRRRAQAAVFVALAADDDVGAEIARFCLADGVLRVGERSIEGLDQVGARAEGRGPRVSLDALLARLEGELDDESKQAAAARRMMEQEREANLLDTLTDSETGLFDGPFATFKLDEEFKRAARFHQPLSLLLVDIGVGESDLPTDPDDRRQMLAEVASVFLNECRDIDILARYTPSVFLFLLPGTGADGAQALCRRMLESLRARSFGPGQDLEPVGGVATVPRADVPNPRAFLGAAEACLALAQRGQGDRGLCSAWD